MEQSIKIIARLSNEVLIIHEGDIRRIDAESSKAFGVQCVRVDLDKGTIDEPVKFFSHLKYNNWQAVTGTESEILWKQINVQFSDEDIKHKIIAPLNDAFIL